MITEITLYSDFESTEHTEKFFGGDFDNGININFKRLKNEDIVKIKIMDDGEILLIPEFELPFEELKLAIKAMEQ